MNKYNLKSGDRYKVKDFLGEIVIVQVLINRFIAIAQNVSGSNYNINITFEDFNNKMISGEINLIKK